MHTAATVAPRRPFRFTWRPAHALREALREGYTRADLQRDILAGIVVGVVALPLSMALAIASGVPPQHGLYTAIIGGGLIALLGGSRVQVSGPTAAFVVILAPIAAQHGVAGLLVATLMAGVILVLMGLGGLGRLIEFIPYPVTTGFTAGIAIVIATLQLKDFFGLTVDLPDHYLQRVAALATHAATARWQDAAVGAATLAMLVLVPRVIRRIPAPIIALGVACLAAALLSRTVPGFSVATIQSRFGGVPRGLPVPAAPWSGAGSTGGLPDLGALIGPAFAIAMLGAIESLLSAVVADGMTGRRHNPDAELVAQGIGNIAAPFFGGIAATGAIARTATNIRSGGRTPVAAVVHALFVLAAMALMAPLLGYLPMASLAALLMLVAWRMSEAHHVIRVVRIGPRSDVTVLLLCLALTVIFDMVVAVSVGVVLAALLFMRRMAEMATVRLVAEDHPELSRDLPEGVIIYEIGGPLFFGAAQKAAGALASIRSDAHLVVFDMRGVPTMDATGLVNLESTLDTLHRNRRYVLIAGVQEQPLHLMARAGWKHRPWLTVYRSFDDAMALARTLSRSDFEAAGVTPSPSTSERRPR